MATRSLSNMAPFSSEDHPNGSPTGGENRSSRYARQELLLEIGREGQERIRRSTVVVIGCGALGTHLAEYLARAGVGRLRLIDRDVVDWSNLQRQISYVERDAEERTPKAIALARRLAEANREVELDVRAEDLRPENAIETCRGADIIVDGTDNIPTRFLLNDVSLALEIPWVYGGVLRASGMVAAFSGTGGPCLRCMFPDLPPPGALPTCETAGVLGPAVGIVSGVEGVLALRILAGASPEEIYGRLFRFDAWTLAFRTAKIDPDPRCPTCALRDYRSLAGEASAEADVLCGRHAVQVRPARRARSSSIGPASGIDLAGLARRMARHGRVDERELFIRVGLEDCVVTVFRDGRAIFDGLTDPARARSLYDLLIGE